MLTFRKHTVLSELVYVDDEKGKTVGCLYQDERDAKRWKFEPEIEETHSFTSTELMEIALTIMEFTLEDME